MTERVSFSRELLSTNLSPRPLFLSQNSYYDEREKAHMLHLKLGDDYRAAFESVA